MFQLVLTVLLVVCVCCCFLASPLQVVCVVFSGVNVYLNMLYLPFYKPAMNLANLIHGCIFASASLMLTYARMRQKAEVRLSRAPIPPPPPPPLLMSAITGEGGKVVQSWHNLCTAVQRTCEYSPPSSSPVSNAFACFLAHLHQENAEAFTFLLTIPVAVGLAYLGYKQRFDMLRKPQLVHSPYMVRSLQHVGACLVITL